MSRRAFSPAATGRTAAAAVALAVLTALVATGALSPLDQYAVDHWMPNYQPSTGSGHLSIVHLFYPHFGSPLQLTCNFWTFPASVFVSGTAIGICCVVLVRRGRRGEGLVWLGAWVVANAVEVVGKTLVHKPTLDVLEAGSRVTFDSFGHSFPSGHALRALLTAAIIAMVWRRAAVPALAWAAVAVPALVVNAAHTPSDVLGGALLALLTFLVAQTVIRDRVVAA